MPKSTSTKLWKNLTCAVVTISTVSISETCALAQIAPDNTLGAESSTVTSGTNIGGVESTLIDGGAIRDTNLFHSFQEFSVGEGKGAYFTNPLGVESIFSRVTGGNASQILGKLGVLGDASLFLINPNGIVFGSTATLDTKGSFIGTTAQSINFADGVQFIASPSTTTPLLTVSVPVGLHFGLQPKSIQVEGNGQIIRQPADLLDTTFGLQVQPDQTLALVGGDISLLGGTIKSAGGQVALGSVDSYSLVNLIPSIKGWDLDYSTVNNFRDILLANTALINVSGQGSGNAQLNSRSLTLQDGSQIEASTLGSISGGIVDINATDSVTLIGGSGDPDNSSGLTAQVYSGATGNGSNLTIDTKNLNLSDGAQIITGTYSTGSAGNLDIRAESVALSGILPAKEFVVSGLFTSVNPGATGDSGKLTIETKHLTLQDGAQIFAGTRGAGSAGDLTVKASESITVSGTSPIVSRFGSALATSVNPGATGNGGNLTLETKQLNVDDGALVSTSTFGRGKAGNLKVVATETINLTGTSADVNFPSRITARSGTSGGDAGNLTIESRQLNINEGATVTASSTGTGNAGSVDINSRSVQLSNLASIVTESNFGQGGDIDLKSQNLSLQGNSRISTTAGIAGTGGNGGDITINTNTLVALEDSNITANAFEGRGGNIQIATQGLFISPDSDITASSRFGIDGVINIQTLGFDVRNSLTTLKNNLISSEQIIAGSCLARRNTERSSFVVTGSGSLPVNPYSEIQEWEIPLPQSQLSVLDSIRPDRSIQRSPSSQITPAPKKWKLGDPIVEAQGIVRLSDGRVLLGMKPQNPASPESIICRS